MPYDEHQRCREIADRKDGEIEHLSKEVERLTGLIKSYESSENLTVKRTCHVPTKGTKLKTVLMGGDRIIIMRKQGPTRTKGE